MACAPDAIRMQVQRMLASADFDASERNRRFLQFVVEETLAGRAERIKAYPIATLVFGRDESFDPQLDPIVRIEASRLRRSLERYYLTSGKDDPVRISIPKGSYVPAFELADAGQLPPDDAAWSVEPIVPREGSPSPPRYLARPRHFGMLAGAVAVLTVVWIAVPWFAGQPPFDNASSRAPEARHGPSILVMPFEEDGDPSAFPNFTRGFTREVIVGLTRFNDLFVFGPETTFHYGSAGDVARISTDLGVDFILTGGASLAADHFKVQAILSDARTGQYLWADHLEGALGTKDILKARDEVANQVARSLAQPYGVIFANQVRESEGKPPETLTSYECMVRFYVYWRSYRREAHRPVRACLEQAIAADPGYAEAYAALSLIHSDAYRFGFEDAGIAGDPRTPAVRLARRAIELAPGSARGYHALAMAYWLTNDVERSLELAHTGFELNPNDTEIMAELGLRHAMRAEWDNALPLVQQAYARNPAQPSSYRIALFLNHYAGGRYREALAEARSVEAPNVLYGHVAVAAAAGQLGRTQEAKAALDRVLAIDPAYADHVVGDLAKRNLHPDLVPRLVDGLRKAGLQSDSVSAKPPARRS